MSKTFHGWRTILSPWMMNMAMIVKSSATSVTGLIRGIKRHPTVEDDVVIYAGATILGGTTVIGRGSVIGGSVWLTTSVPPFTRVTIAGEQLRFEARAVPQPVPPAVDGPA